jgi:hypothetical protein
MQKLLCLLPFCIARCAQNPQPTPSFLFSSRLAIKALVEGEGAVSEMSEVTPEEPSEERRKEIRDEAREFAREKRANYVAISADAWKQGESARST